MQKRRQTRKHRISSGRGKGKPLITCIFEEVCVFVEEGLGDKILPQ
jgi:hypothetical protein